MILLLLALNLADVSSSTGVNIHFTGAPAKDLDMIQQAGFGWIRMDFGWGAIERKKGTYRFDDYDALLDGLSARGIKALFILDYSNSLYEKDRSVRTEEGRKAFARFAAEAAKRYRGRGVRWEVWNEPNLEGFWRPQPAADDYAALVIECAKAIRAADPDAVILAPASSGFPWSFLERIFEKGVLEHIDEVSVHPYRSSPPETVAEDYARLRELIAKNLPAGRKAPPIVSGEWGYSTLHHGGKPFSPEVQGMYLAREFLTNIAEGIPLSIWYDWANDGPDPKETEHNFGTVTLQREPKPAYLAAKTLMGILGKSAFERRLRAGRDDHLLLFKSGGRRFLAAWTVGPEHPVSVQGKGLEGPLSSTGYTGEASKVEAKGGVLQLPLSSRPRYVEIPEAAGPLATHGLEAELREHSIRLTATRSGEGAAEARIELEVLEESPEPAQEPPGSREGENSRETTPLAATVKKQSLSEGQPAVVEVPVEWPRGKRVRVMASLIDPASERTLAVLCPRPGGKPGLACAVAGVFDKMIAAVAATPAPGTAGPSDIGFSVALDGEASVKAEAKLSSVSLGGEAGAPASRALRLDYRFEKGWRFVRVVPEREEPALRGRLSVWVKGDGSGNSLRARFRDSRGETFQPTVGPLNWKGWKRVEIPTDGADAGSWGGDGKVDYPIRWDSLFLIDSTREGGAGTVEFAAPIWILDS